MSEPTLYDVLQVVPTADPEVIEAAHRRLARKYHPDVNSDPDAADQMKRINAAYEVLRDPARRGRYDQTLQRAASEPEPAAPAESAPPAAARPAAANAARAPRRRIPVLPISAGFAATVGLMAAFLWLSIEVLPSGSRSGPSRAAVPSVTTVLSREPAATASVVVATRPTLPVPTTPPTSTPLPRPTSTPPPTSTPVPEPVAAAEPAPAEGPVCESLPDSAQPGTEFDVVTLTSETVELPVVGGLLIVRGEVRNNCDQPRGASLSFVVRDEAGEEVGRSERPVVLEGLEPGEVRAFRFEPVRAPGGRGVDLTVTPS